MATKGTLGVASFLLKDIPIENFPPEGIQCDLPLIRPLHHRPFENAQREEVLILKEEVASWLELHFVDSGDSTEYVENLSSSTVDAALWMKPEASLDPLDKKLALLGYMTAWLFFLDDWGENWKADSDEDQNGQESGLVRVAKLVESQAGENDAELAKDIDIEMFHDQPMIPKLYGALSEISDMAKGCGLTNFKNEMRKRLHLLLKQYTQSSEWHKIDPITNYSEMTVRYHRLLDGLTKPSFESLSFIHGVSVPNRMKEHPMFHQLIALMDNIVIVFNDVMSFKKDVLTKETGGLVMYKILKKGLTPKQAIEEEIAFAKSCMEDYCRLKPFVLRQFKDCPDVDKYVELMEIVCYAQYQMLCASPRYSMKDVDIQFRAV